MDIKIETPIWSIVAFHIIMALVYMMIMSIGVIFFVSMLDDWPDFDYGFTDILLLVVTLILIFFFKGPIDLFFILKGVARRIEFDGHKFLVKRIWGKSHEEYNISDLIDFEIYRASPSDISYSLFFKGRDRVVLINNGTKPEMELRDILDSAFPENS